MTRRYIFKILLLVASSLMLHSQANATTLAEFDFDSGNTAFTYEYAYAGHGEGDPNMNVDDTAMVSATGDSMASGNPGNAGCGTGDFTNWAPPMPNNYTYAGFAYAAAVDLTSPLTSSNLADYDVSFDASGSGATGIGGRIDVILRDAAGNQISFLRQTGLGYVPGFNTFNVNFGAATLVGGATQADFDAGFADVTRMEFVVVAETNFANAGADADNVVCMDNVVLTGPVPEPAGAMLLLLGALGFFTFCRR